MAIKPYLILSDGMYAGTTDEPITDKVRFTRILSDGLLAIAPSPVTPTGNYFYLARNFLRNIVIQWSQ